MSGGGKKKKCVTCNRILEGSEQTQGQCHTCRSPEGKIADLDIAIRSRGDTPRRIDSWPEIRYWLERRFAKPREKVSAKWLWRKFRDWARFKRKISNENEFLAYPLSQIVKWLEHDFKNSGKPNPPMPPSSEVPKKALRKAGSKRSTEKGEAREKLISALTLHHQYSNGSCLNQEPIGNNQLALIARVSPASASAFFKKQFGGYRNYRRICSNTNNLIAALKVFNNEIFPKVFLDPNLADKV